MKNLALPCFKKFHLQAHRGVQSLFPENTLKAFHEAWKLGCDCIELDLVFSKDGFVIIHHDFYIKDQAIINLSLEEIKTFPVGDVLNPNFPEQQKATGEKIPTLEELFLFFKDHKHFFSKPICFNLEIKSDPRFPDLTGDLEIFIKEIVRYVELFQMKDYVYFSSFNPKAIEILKKVYPSAISAFLLKPNFDRNLIDSLIEICENIGVEIVSPYYQWITPEAIDRFKKSNLKIVTWTVNLRNDFEKLKNLGVDGMITDYPQRFL